jgi:DNA repair protein RadD
LITPRYYQSEAAEANWQHMLTRPGNCLTVLPTGAGKSLLIAMLCQRAVMEFKGRVIVLAHRKELLIQNADKIKALMPGVDIGIYSAGLNSRDVDHDVIVAGIQSIHNKAHLLGRRHLVIPDEAHLIPASGEGMYRSFLTDLAKLNPKLRVAGLTATPYRTGEGKLCGEKNLFQEICYSASVSKLISEGYLSNLITLPADNSVDTSKLHIRAGEFRNDEMLSLFEGEEKVNAACGEIVAKTLGRRSILVFCPGVFHAAATAKKLHALTGEEVGIVTGETPAMERAALLARFKAGLLRWLVNVDVLTTGFDAPNIDAIAILRATMSAGLAAQMVGRGLRICPEKTDCLILDFGQNFKRFGPLDSDTYGHEQVRERVKGDRDAPTKECPSCEELCPISARKCPECDWLFPPPDLAKHETNPDGSAILEKDIIPDRWAVDAVNFSRHAGKEGKQDTLRVDYTCRNPDETGDMAAIKTVSEWVCLEHDGYAGKKAGLWATARTLAPVTGIDSAVGLWKRGAFASPSFITTRPDGRFTKIVSVELDPRPETWEEETENEASMVDAFDSDDIPF